MVVAHQGGIEAIHRRWALSVQHAQIAEIVAPFAADAQVLIPNLPPMVGRPAIAQHWGRLLEAPGTFMGFREGRVRPAPAGDVAYCTGGYLMEFEGNPHRQFEEGKYLTIWRKRHGRWAITFLHAQVRSSGAMFRGQALIASEQRRRVAL
jgi:ketosteroid isomerase-like protein